MAIRHFKRFNDTCDHRGSGSPKEEPDNNFVGSYLRIFETSGDVLSIRENECACFYTARTGNSRKTDHETFVFGCLNRCGEMVDEIDESLDEEIKEREKLFLGGEVPEGEWEEALTDDQQTLSDLSESILMAFAITSAISGNEKWIGDEIAARIALRGYDPSYNAFEAQGKDKETEEGLKENVKLSGETSPEDKKHLYLKNFTPEEETEVCEAFIHLPVRPETAGNFYNLCAMYTEDKEEKQWFIDILEREYAMIRPLLFTHALWHESDALPQNLKPADISLGLEAAFLPLLNDYCITQGTVPSALYASVLAVYFILDWHKSEFEEEFQHEPYPRHLFEKAKDVIASRLLHRKIYEKDQDLTAQGDEVWNFIERSKEVLESTFVKNGSCFEKSGYTDTNLLFPAYLRTGFGVFDMPGEALSHQALVSSMRPYSGDVLSDIWAYFGPMRGTDRRRKISALEESLKEFPSIYLLSHQENRQGKQLQKKHREILLPWSDLISYLATVRQLNVCITMTQMFEGNMRVLKKAQKEARDSVEKAGKDSQESLDAAAALRQEAQDLLNETKKNLDDVLAQERENIWKTFKGESVEKDKRIKALEEEVSTLKGKHQDALKALEEKELEKAQGGEKEADSSDAINISTEDLALILNARYKGMILGGHPNHAKKLRALLPDWKFIECSTGRRISKSELLNTDVLVACVEHLDHSTYNSATAQARLVSGNTIPTVTISGTNVDAQLREVYNRLKANAA